MKTIIQTIVLLGIGLSAYSQFTVVPTTTSTAIESIVLNADTIVISGYYDYFAKSYDWCETVVDFDTPGISGAANYDFQIRDSIYYIRSGTGFPEYHFQILKSKDFGESWQTLYDTTGISFYTFTMADSTWGLMAGLFGQYTHCNNADTSWTTELLFNTEALNCIASDSYEDSTMIFLDVSGAAIYTTDRGGNWNWGYCNSQIHEDIQYINQDTIYSISHYNSGIISEFSYSIDGGHHFWNVELGPNDNDTTYYGTYFDTRIYDMQFVTPSHGYIVGYNYDIDEGVIFETTDYGLHWTVYATGFNEELSALLIVNDRTAFIGGTNGLLLKWNPSVYLSPLGVDELSSTTSKFSIFPNPSNENVTIQLSEPSRESQLSICNSLGEEVLCQPIHQRQISISTKNFADGLYYISLSNSNRITTRKLIIQH